MKKIKKIICLCLMFALVCCFASCKNDISENDVTEKDTPSSLSSSEDYFEWEGNIIIGLTESGAKQKSIVIPERCEGFDGMIFADIENKITSVSFESDKNIELNGVFGSAKKIKSIDLPNQLTTIGNLEFWLCDGLEKIKIPASVTSIGEYAFQDNKSLKMVEFEGNIENIDAHAFDGCSLLSTIVFPNSITNIGEYAFFKCTALQSITLPSSLKTIGKFAFANSGVTDITVPDDLVLQKYATTSFVQYDHNINIHITKNSWMDQNFENVFDGAFDKSYN